MYACQCYRIRCHSQVDMMQSMQGERIKEESLVGDVKRYSIPTDRGVKRQDLTHKKKNLQLVRFPISRNKNKRTTICLDRTDDNLNLASAEYLQRAHLFLQAFLSIS